MWGVLIITRISKVGLLLLMEEILHHLKFYELQQFRGFRRCKFPSINSINLQSRSLKKVLNFRNSIQGQVPLRELGVERLGCMSVFRGRHTG